MTWDIMTTRDTAKDMEFMSEDYMEIMRFGDRIGAMKTGARG